MDSSNAALLALIDRVREAASTGRRLRVQGGGSKDFYGEAARGEPLSTSELRGILSYEPSELVITALAGTPLAELEAALAEKGQVLAFEPPHFGAHATVGGMVAAGLAGPARASVGGVRDYVLGASLINGRAELLSFGGQVMKNVAGYDVSRLLAGSLGTLGVITGLSLKVLPRAPAEATLACAGLAHEPALALLHRWGGQPLPLHASCWVHDDTGTPAEDFLFVRLRGAHAAVQAAQGRMSADARAAGARVSLLDPQQARADWAACREHTLPFFRPPAAGLCLWRLSVPQTTPVLDLPAPVLIEWQGGLRWLWAPASAAATLRQAAARVGGHATLFRGDASDKAVGVFSPLAPAQRRIQLALQRQFDPQGVFDAGRLFGPT